MTRTTRNTLLITALFIGIYIVLRNLPSVKCEVLHYEVTKTTEQGIEMCADGPSGMIDLEKVSFPGVFDLMSPTELVQGETYEGIFTIGGPRGGTILPHELAITHTERIHLLVVHESLEDYHHLHPTPSSNLGQWTFEFEPSLTGAYNIYVETVPIRTKKQLMLHQSINVLPAADSLKQQSQNSVTNTHLEWNFYDEKLRKRSWIDFEIKLTHPEGEALKLEKVMDAYSHVVAFSENVVGYAHIHPLEEDNAPDPVSPTFQFRFFSGESGNYRLWAQFQIEGKPVFKSYDFVIP